MPAAFHVIQGGQSARTQPDIDRTAVDSIYGRDDHESEMLVASDTRPIIIRLLSRIISVIRTAGAAWRMLRSIPSEVRSAWRNAGR